jgi:hypothetical protein
MYCQPSLLDIKDKTHLIEELIVKVELLKMMDLVRDIHSKVLKVDSQINQK